MRVTGVATIIVVSLCAGGLGCRDAEPETEEGSTGVAGSSSSESSESTGTAVAMAQSLVRADSWEVDAAEDDPFPDERPELTMCEVGFDEETGAFEVATDLCRYGSFSQRTLAAIHEGDTLEFILIHDALYAEEPAVAHVAITFGSEIAWETELAIPAEAAQIRPSWVAPADVAIGTDVHFHLHNHGVNNYRFIDLTVTPG